MSERLAPFLRDYRLLLEEVDAWFCRCAEAFPDQIACTSGCSGCCRGLFDITLLDAALLRSAFDTLDPSRRRRVLEKARTVARELQGRWVGFGPPFVLNALPHAQWMAMPQESPCVLLSEQGRCLLYEARPMTCRLHGLPHIDLTAEVFEGDFCTLNFTGADPFALPELRWEFRRLFERELALFQEFTRALLGAPLNELDTFIPTALLIDFPSLADSR